MNVQLQSDKGISDSTGLGLVIEANKGLSVGASGLATVIEANKGLSVGASGLATVIEANKGIVVGANGLSIDLDASSITTNGKLAMTSLATLSNSIVPVTNGSGVITSSSVTATELATIGGVAAGTATASKY